jgi:biotin carboxyl carrier protein
MATSARYFAKNLTAGDAGPTTVLVETLSDGRYAVTLDGERQEVESLTLPHGTVSLLVGDQSYSVEFEDRGDEVKVLLRGQVTRFDIADERRLRVRQLTQGFAHEGQQTLRAPMPGKVVRVFVGVGDQVVAGQGLVVVEAMKMENELKAQRAGTVVQVLAKEGTPVENGALLLVIE